MIARGTAAAVVFGLAIGWNIANIGAIAEPLADEYGVGLAVVGLFTTALVLVHALVQIPSGKTIDRLGAYPVALAGMGVIAATNALLLVASDPGLALAGRALMGFGTAACFVSGSDYLRVLGGGGFGVGLFGGAGMAGGGIALAVVPQLEGWLGWRAPYSSALVFALVALAVFALAPRVPRARLHEDAGPSPALLRDRRLYRVSTLQMVSLGLNALIANWVVTLLVRAGDLSLGEAGAASALTLAAGIVSRPLGGWLARRHPEWARAAIAWSMVAGAAGTALLLVARPLALMVVASGIVGLAAGLPFATAFGAAARLRPDAPGAAVGLVNMLGNGVVVVGTPLVGLTFDLPGDGRIGFAIIAALWAAAVLVLPPARDLAESPQAGRAIA